MAGSARRYLAAHDGAAAFDINADILLLMKTGVGTVLILSRRVSESIRVGDEIIITVLGVKGNQVRIGIDAPREVAVHREDIYKRIMDGEEPTKSEE